MTVGLWHSRVPASKATAYRAFLGDRAIPDCRPVSGNIRVHVLAHRKGEVTNFVTMTVWNSLDSIKGFAGKDVEAAKDYPEDTDLLLEFQPTVVHYEVGKGFIVIPFRGKSEQDSGRQSGPRLIECVRSGERRLL